MKMPHEEPPISPARAASVAIMTKVACYPDVHEEAKVRANGKEQTVSNVKTNQKKSKKAKDKNKKTSSRPDCVIIPPVNQECSDTSIMSNFSSDSSVTPSVYVDSSSQEDRQPKEHKTKKVKSHSKRKSLGRKSSSRSLEPSALDVSQLPPGARGISEKSSDKSKKEKRKKKDKTQHEEFKSKKKTKKKGANKRKLTRSQSTPLLLQELADMEPPLSNHQSKKYSIDKPEESVVGPVQQLRRSVSERGQMIQIPLVQGDKNHNDAKEDKTTTFSLKKSNSLKNLLQKSVGGVRPLFQRSNSSKKKLFSFPSSHEPLDDHESSSSSFNDDIMREYNNQNDQTSGAKQESLSKETTMDPGDNTRGGVHNEETSSRSSSVPEPKSKKSIKRTKSSRQLQRRRSTDPESTAALKSQQSRTASKKAKNKSSSLRSSFKRTQSTPQLLSRIEQIVLREQKEERTSLRRQSHLVRTHSQRSLYSSDS